MAIISGGKVIEGARGRAGVVSSSNTDTGGNVGPFSMAGVPVDGTSGSFVGEAGPGALVIDTTNKNVYVNANTLASPTWKLVTRAA